MFARYGWLALGLLGTVLRAQNCTWTEPGGGLVRVGLVDDFASFDDGAGPALFVAGYFGEAGDLGIRRWDGTRWGSVGGGADHEVSGLTVFDDGSGAALYATGSFSRIGTVAVSPGALVRWNGTQWQRAPMTRWWGGTYRPLLETLDDGTGPKLFVANGNVIASWTAGTGWLTLPAIGGPLPPSVVGILAATMFDDGTGPALHVAGQFPPSNAYAVMRWNGSAWVNVGSTADNLVRSLAVFDDGAGPTLYAAGDFRTIGGTSLAYVARWNGNAWTAVAPSGGPSTPVFRLAVVDDGTGPALVAGSKRDVMGWNGIAWSQVTAVDAACTSIALFDDGSGVATYFGGSFTIANGAPALAVAARRAAGVGPVGTGLAGDCPGEILALQSVADRAGPALYAADEFNVAGGIAAANIARWDGRTWSPLGTGLRNSAGFTRVNAMTTHADGNGAWLFASGNFDSAGGTAADRIARWDGRAWSGVGGGFPVGSWANCMRSFGGDLYAGGAFTSVGSIAAKNIARWDGTNWNALGTGLRGATYESVEAMTTFDDGTGESLYVGGAFVSANGVPCNAVARWNGTNWSAVGALAAQGVSALQVFDDGSGPALFALSWLPTAVVKWDGGRWTTIGTPTGAVFDAAHGLAVFTDAVGPALWVGGEFDHMNGVAAEGLARWDGASWTGVSPGVRGYQTAACRSIPRVDALEVFHDGVEAALYAGGMVGSVAGVRTNAIARYGCQGSHALHWSQPNGPATPVYVSASNLVPNREYFVLFSIEPCAGGLGTGPWLGLCATTPSAWSVLVNQLLLPLGNPPFHFVANATAKVWGPYQLVPGTVLDAVCVDATFGRIGPLSDVIRLAPR